MKNKTKLRTKITISIGLILFISNMLLIGLLYYNFIVSMNGFEIPIEGQLVEFYFADGLEIKLLVLGIIIGIITTLLGTLLTYFLLGKILTPLQKLTAHMLQSDRENIPEQIELKSDICEIDSLVTSFNSMSNKLKIVFDNQARSSSFIAHEFRTPLAVIQTKIDVYKKQPDNNSEELITDISAQTAKLTVLVNEILNLTNIQRIELTEQVPVNILLEEVIDNLEIIAGQKNVMLELNCPEDENNSLIISGNYDLLYQAFYNLIENGIKYNHEDGKVIIIVGQLYNKINVVIKDTGCGIPKEDREKIFYPFYRCKQAKGNAIKGNGIGLAFSKQVFDHHKCNLKLKESDDGTCFEISMNKFCL